MCRLLTATPTQAQAGLVIRAQRHEGSDAFLQLRQRPAGNAAHMRPGRLVAHDQRVRLAAVQQAQGDAGVGRMIERTLALDQVPVVGVRWPAPAPRRRRR